MSYQKKVGYLKGLAKGLALDEATKEGGVLLAIIDLLEDMADKLSDVEETNRKLKDDVDDLDDKLDDMEDEIDALSEGMEQFVKLLTGDADDDDEDFSYNVECPKCGKAFTVTEDMLEKGGITCPTCSEPLEIETECADPHCCGHHEHK